MRTLLLPMLLLAGCGGHDRALLIGDSISLGYTPYVQDRVLAEHDGDCSLPPFRLIPGQADNAETSAHARACMGTWLASGPYTVVHFGVGMWDLLGCEPQGVTPLSDYLDNLQAIVDAIRATGARPVFATITPVEPGNAYCVDPVLVEQYNAAAAAMMRDEGVDVDDLYAAMEPVQGLYHPLGDIHYTDDGYRLLAGYVVLSLQK